MTADTAPPRQQAGEPLPSTMRRFNSPHTLTPRTHLLSNGRYAVMITAAGSGYSRWRDIAVTRWQEDVTCDRLGQLRFPSRYARAARCGRQAISRAAPSRTATTARFLRRAGPKSSGTMARSRRRWKWRFHRRTTPRCAASRSPTTAARSGKSSSPPTPKSCWRRRPPTMRTRHSQRCSSRRSSLPRSARFWPRGGDGSPGDAAGLGGASRRRRRRDHRRCAVRDRSGALPRARTRHSDADRHDRRTRARQHSRRRARSDLQPAPPGADPAGTHRAHCVLDADRPLARRSARSGRTSITARWRSIARPRWPGPRRRCSSAISGSTPTKRTSFSVSPIACSMPTRRCARLRDPRARRRAGIAALAARDIRRPADHPGYASTQPSDLEIVRQLLLAHEYWRMKQLAVDLVIVNEQPTSYAQEFQAALEALVRGDRFSTETHGERRAKERYSSCAPTWSRSRCATCCRPRPARCSSGIAAASPSKSHGRRSRSHRPRRQGASPASAPPQAALPRPALEFFNGLGGFADDGREYVGRPRRGTMDARALDQRHLQPCLRLSGLGRGQRLHVVAQQSAEPHHPVVERSRERYAGRGDLSCAMRTAANFGGRRRCRSARTGRTTSPGTVRAIAASSTSRTAFRSNCCNTCRSTIRSRYPA